MNETTEPTKAPTIQELATELQQWCAQRGVVIGVVAQGVRSGQPSAIEDFMPVSGSHVATWALQFVKKR